MLRRKQTPGLALWFDKEARWGGYRLHSLLPHPHPRACPDLPGALGREQSEREGNYLDFLSETNSRCFYRHRIQWFSSPKLLFIHLFIYLFEGNWSFLLFLYCQIECCWGSDFKWHNAHIWTRKAGEEVALGRFLRSRSLFLTERGWVPSATSQWDRTLVLTKHLVQVNWQHGWHSGWEPRLWLRLAGLPFWIHCLQLMWSRINQCFWASVFLPDRVWGED